VSYYVFEEGFMSCTNTGDNQTDIALTIKDSETGEDSSDEFGVEMELPEGKSCPSACLPGVDNKC